MSAPSVVSPTSGSVSPLGDNGSAGAGVSVGGSPHHPSCTSWSHMFCEGQGCIDKYTPCRGKCWSHTATRLCGDNMCLSEYQLEDHHVCNGSCLHHTTPCHKGVCVSSDYLPCSSGDQCYRYWDYCDNEKHCLDGSDEGSICVARDYIVYFVPVLMMLLIIAMLIILLIIRVRGANQIIETVGTASLISNKENGNNHNLISSRLYKANGSCLVKGSPVLITQNERLVSPAAVSLTRSCSLPSPHLPQTPQLRQAVVCNGHHRSIQQLVTTARQPSTPNNWESCKAISPTISYQSTQSVNMNNSISRLSEAGQALNLDSEFRCSEERLKLASHSTESNSESCNHSLPNQAIHYAEPTFTIIKANQLREWL